MADGTIIKKTWQIVGEIGAGGMGTVYEVKHVRLGKRYALKQLKQEFANRPDVKHRFDREAMTMAELQHPHIVQVYDIDVEPDFGAFILMDLINGSNLGKIIREQGRRSYSEVLRIGSEIASALDFAHRRGVVHRDIKPGNILIEEGTGRAVLTDFGIAKQLNPETDETEGTKTGVFIGTYRYSSPEQMRNEEPDPRWDIYSFGIVLYEAYSGNRFLENMSEGQVVAHVAYMPDWRPNLDCPDPPPEEFLRVVASCLERDREKRTATAADLVRQLAECRKNAPAEPEASAAPGAIAPQPQDLPTAITQQESYTAIRGALRAEAEGQINRLRRLEEDLATLGVSDEDWTSSSVLRERLAAVGELEGKEQFNEAMAGLEALGERATEVYRSIEASLRETLGNGIAEVRGRWQSLVERGGDLVPAAQGVELNQLLATAERCQTSGDWMAGWRGLNEGRPLVERAEANARNQANARVESSLGRIAAAVETLRAAQAEPAAALDIDAIRAEVAQLIDAGRLAEGVRRAETAGQEADGAIAALRQKQKERAAKARARVEQLLGDIDLTAAGAVANDLVVQGRAAQDRGASADGQNDFVVAADAYDAAFTAFQNAAAKLRQAQKGELDTHAAELSRLLAQAEAAPEAITGKVARRAREVLTKAASGDPARNLAAIDEVRAEVEQAIESAAAFAAASERQRAADALQERVAQLSVASREQRAARQSMQDAAAAFKRERWSEARDRYAEAEAAWAALARDVEERDHAAKEESQHGEIQRRQAALQEQLPATRRLQEAAGRLELEVPEAASIVDLEESLRRVAEQEQQGQLDDALRTLSVAEEQARSIRAAIEDSLQAKLTEESAEVTQRWQDVESRAGSLLSAEQAEGVTGCLSSAQQHVQAHEWIKGWQELSAGRERIDRAESEAAELVRGRVGGLLEQAESYLNELRRAEATELVDGFDLSQLRSDVAARMEGGLYAQAGQLVESPLQRLSAAVRQLRQTHEERLAASRSAVDALAAGADSPEAREVAGALLERARAARAEAGKAEKAGDHPAALRAYEAARQSYEQAARQVTQRRLDELSAQVRAKLEGAPESIAGDATRQARQALEKSSAADPSAAIAALLKAREGLDTAFAQAKAREEAERVLARQLEEARQRLQALIDRSRDLPPDIAGAALGRAEEVLADAGAKVQAVEEAQLRVEQSHAEAKLFGAADEARQAAKSEEQAVLARQPSERSLKAARKRMAEADGAFANRQWKPAREGYAAASTQLASVKTKPQPSAAVTAEGTATDTGGRRSVAGIAAAAVAVLAIGAVVYLRPWAETSPPLPPEQPVREEVVPEEPVKKPEVVPPVEPEVASKQPQDVPPPPPPDAVVPFSIAAVSPSAAEVSVAENGRTKFSVEVKGGAEGEAPPSEWTLGGARVASDATSFEYKPDFDAARAEPYDLTVRFGKGDELLATHSWKVRVEPVNRDPILVEASPARGETMRGKPGATVAFSVKAKDPDDDELQYAWTVGGKPAAEKGPKLQLKVARNEQVAVSVRDRSDGKALTATWNVEAEKVVPPTVVVAAIAPFQLEPRPSKLSRLQLEEPATFELVTPKELRLAKIDYEWTVDGRKVSSDRSFRFDTSDPGLVSGKPVRIRVAATDDKRRSFKHEWSVNVVPPPPKITAAQPVASSLELAPGASQAFEVDAASPVGNQALTYVFQTNGKEASSAKPRYDFVAGGPQDYTIVASVKDNYGQTSKESRTWRVKVASQEAEVGKLVEGWLDNCQSAFNRKDVAKLGELLRLDSGKQRSLEGVLKNQRDLRVAFRDVQIDKVDPTRARVSYKRVDEFVDERTGKSMSLSIPMKQTFRVENGRAVLDK